MIIEGLFVYLPTIIAITIAFFVGVGVGLFLCITFGVIGFLLLEQIPPLKEKLIGNLKSI
jgi:hypothetical protein